GLHHDQRRLPIVIPANVTFRSKSGLTTPVEGALSPCLVTSALGRERQSRPRRRLRPRRCGRARSFGTASARKDDGGLVGISRGKGGGRRTAGRKLDPRTKRGAGNRRQGSVLGTADVREPRLSRFPPAYAVVRVPAVGRDSDAEGRPTPCLGTTESAARVSDAARGRTSDRPPDGIVVIMRDQPGWL